MLSEENKVLSTKITTGMFIKIIVAVVAIVGSLFTAVTKYNTLENRVYNLEISDGKQDVEIDKVSELKDLISAVNNKIDTQGKDIERIKKNLDNKK